MSPFESANYKDFLRSHLAHDPRRGAVSRLANACGCDRTYLSQSLNGKAELTPDHIIQLCLSLSLSASEERYLLLMLLRDRSSLPSVRRRLQLELNQLKREFAALSKKVEEKEETGTIAEKDVTLYYSNWMYSAVHTLISIPAFQTANQICEKLGAPNLVVSKILKDLTAMGLARHEQGKFIHSGESIYLPASAPQINAHHFGWRMKAVERSAILEDIHYTVAFSLSKEDIEKVREQIVSLIENQRKLVHESGTEVAAVFCCDFFMV